MNLKIRKEFEKLNFFSSCHFSKVLLACRMEQKPQTRLHTFSASFISAYMDMHSSLISLTKKNASKVLSSNM